MRVGRKCLRRDRHLLHTSSFADDSWRKTQALSLMQRHTALEIGIRKCIDAVAAVRCADESEQRFILSNLLELTVALCEVNDGEVAREHPDLADEWGAHVRSLLVSRRENTKKTNTERKNEIRLHVVVRLALSEGP